MDWSRNRFTNYNSYKTLDVNSVVIKNKFIVVIYLLVKDHIFIFFNLSIIVFCDCVTRRKKKCIKIKLASKSAKVNGNTSVVDDSSKASETETSITSDTEKTKVLGGEVIRTWKTTSRYGKQGKYNQLSLVQYS